jgi:ERF superfamily
VTAAEEKAPTPPLVTVTQALTDVARAIGAVGKPDYNKQQDFPFRGIDTIMAKAGPALIDAGVVITPKVLKRSVEIIEVGRDHKPWRLVTLTVRWTAIGPLGDKVRACTVGEGFDGGDKAANKAMTGSQKYALLALLNIHGTGVHDDADGQTYEEPSGGGERAPARKTRRGGSASASSTKDGKGSGGRTPAERRILAAFRALSVQRQAEVRMAFVAKFGTALNNLDPARHDEAETWFRAAIVPRAKPDAPAPPEAAGTDEAWVAEARAGVAPGETAELNDLDRGEGYG